jgi:hypothetical protein
MRDNSDAYVDPNLWIMVQVLAYITMCFIVGILLAQIGMETNVYAPQERMMVVLDIVFAPIHVILLQSLELPLAK